MSPPLPNPDLPRLTTRQLTRRLRDVVLVDSHGSAYYVVGHIPGAVNIPPHDVARRASMLLTDTSCRIVVYGARKSSNAVLVAEQLLSLGYTRVAVYDDGLEGWIAAGFPITAAEQQSFNEQPPPAGLCPGLDDDQVEPRGGS